jgi:hypothetical protein
MPALRPAAVLVFVRDDTVSTGHVAPGRTGVAVPAGGHGVVFPAGRPTGLRGSGQPGSLQHELPLAGRRPGRRL